MTKKLPIIREIFKERSLCSDGGEEIEAKTNKCPFHGHLINELLDSSVLDILRMQNEVMRV